MVNMDGSNCILFFSGQKGFVGLVIDFFESKFYWISFGNYIINCCNLDGSGLEVIDVMWSQLGKVIVLVIMGDKLWWVDQVLEKMGICSKVDGLGFVVLWNSIILVMYMKVYDESIQLDYKGINFCSVNNGDCFQFCLFMLEMICFCMCIVGYSFWSGQQVCEGVGFFFLYFVYEGIRGIFLDFNDKLDVLVLVFGILLVVGIDFYVENDIIYWVDMGLSMISWVKWDQMWCEDVVINGIGCVEGIVVDWIVGNIYWMDQGFDVIEVVWFNGFFCYVVIFQGLDKFWVIIVYLEKGYLFWIEWGQYLCIEQFWLDGMECVVLVNVSISWFNGILVDYQDGKLYWCDVWIDKIEWIDLEMGENCEVVLFSNNMDMFLVFVFEDFIYWSDRIYVNGFIK